jgi:outer membrane protein W
MIKVKVSTIALVTVIGFCLIGGITDVRANTDPTDPNTNIMILKTTEASFTPDGLRSPASEYSTAAGDMIELTGSDHIEGKVFLKRYRDNITGDEELRIYFSVHDIDANSNDRIDFYFDRLHDHGNLSDPSRLDDDVILRVERSTCTGPCTFKLGTRAGSGLFQSLNNIPCDAHVIASNAGEYSSAPIGYQDGWTGEIRLTPSDLGWGDFPSLFGCMVEVRSEDSNAISPLHPIETSPEHPNAYYPTISGGDETVPANWGNMKTRYPIHYMICLDQSGSMLSNSRWNHAKTAANFLATTMAIVGHDPYFEDRLGVVTFSWNNSANTDQTSVPKPLGTIPTFPAANYVDAAPAVVPPQGHYYTPIGRGLDSSFSALNVGVVEKKDKVVLLLSDGMHNRPKTPTNEVPLLPTYLSYDPCSGTPNWNTCPAGTDSDVRVSTIAFGNPGTAAEDLLTNIKNRFFGEGTSYNISSDPEDLKEFFLSSLEDLYEMNMIYSGPGPSNFNVNANEGRIIVILSWSNPVNARGFRLQQRDNSSSPWVDITCSPTVENVDVGYAICVIEDPPEGEWRIFELSGDPPLTLDHQFVLVDLNLRATFAIGQRVHGSGQDIILTTSLREAGIPVTNDPVNHPVKVTVNIKRPGEGFGTYVSVRTLSRCEPQPPELPPIDIDPGSTPAGYPSGAFTDIVTQPANIDVKPDHYAKLDSLFKLCEKDSLIYIEDPGIELYDDGTNGDVTPNDGVYTLKFLNTEYEGSYVFRFKASGVSPSGSAFSRIKTLAEYVRVEVDPVGSEAGANEAQQTGNTVVQQLYVIPQDRFQGYLGPGHSDQVRFETTAGSFINPLTDHNNGIYSQLLRYDESTDRPVVTPIVQGKPFRPIRLFKPFEFMLFGGWFIFDDTLGLNDGIVVGGKLGYRFTNQLALELEGGITFTDNAAGAGGKVIQAMGNLRYELPVPGLWKPYVTAGAGYLMFKDFGVNDEAFAIQGGIGATLKLNNSFGLRTEGRMFRINDIWGFGTTTNYQITGGFVFWF